MSGCWANHMWYVDMSIEHGPCSVDRTSWLVLTSGCGEHPAVHPVSRLKAAELLR